MTYERPPLVSNGWAYRWSKTERENNKKENKKEREKEKKDRAYCWLQRIHLRIAAYENNATWSLVTSAARPRFIFQGITPSISSSFPRFSRFSHLPRFRLFHPFCMPEFESRYTQRVVLYYHSSTFDHYICESWAESCESSARVCACVFPWREDWRTGGSGDCKKRLMA